VQLVRLGVDGAIYAIENKGLIILCVHARAHFISPAGEGRKRYQQLMIESSPTCYFLCVLYVEILSASLCVL